MAAAGDSKDALVGGETYMAAVASERAFQARHSKAEVDARGDSRVARVARAQSAFERAENALSDARIAKAAFDDVFAERKKKADAASNTGDELARVAARAKRKHLQQQLAKLDAEAPPTPTSEPASAVSDVVATTTPNKRVRKMTIPPPATPATALSAAVSLLTVAVPHTPKK